MSSLAENAILLLLRQLFEHEEIPYFPLQTVTSNGDSGNIPLIVKFGEVVVFYLDVISVSGTSPTLDLFIDIQDPLSRKWVNQDKFPTISSITTLALALPVRSMKYRIRWILGGVSPSFTFSVGVVIVK
jgi:hypothetical protein